MQAAWSGPKMCTWSTSFCSCGQQSAGRLANGGSSLKEGQEDCLVPGCRVQRLSPGFGTTLLVLPDSTHQEFVWHWQDMEFTIPAISALWRKCVVCSLTAPGQGRGVGQCRQRTRTRTGPDRFHVHAHHHAAAHWAWCAQWLTWLGSGGGAMAAEDTYWNSTSSTGSAR